MEFIDAPNYFATDMQQALGMTSHTCGWHGDWHGMEFSHSVRKCSQLQLSLVEKRTSLLTTTAAKIIGNFSALFPIFWVIKIVFIT